MLQVLFLIALLPAPLPGNDTSGHPARELFVSARRRRSGSHAVV